MRKLWRPNTLFCFSPPVMLATIVVELGLALWVFTRFASRRPRRLIIALLVLLAAFQLAELNVCGTTLPNLIWSRFGYMVITFLPPLALHIVVQVRSEHRPALIGISYALAASFALAFGLAPAGLNHGVCTGNYVIFILTHPLAFWYAVYYYALLAAGLLLSLWPLAKAKRTARQALQWMTVSYLVITIPVFMIIYLLPVARVGIPSIMCGFAVFFALILGLRVAPLSKQL